MRPSTTSRTRAALATALAATALAGPAGAQDPAPVVPAAPAVAENPLDTTAPRLTLSGRRVQRLAPSLEAFGACDEPCEFDASARVLNVPGLTHLRVVTPEKASAGGTRMRFEIRVSPRAHKLMAGALRDRVRVRVELVVLAYDFADNETERARRLRVVPPRPPVRR